MPEPGFVGTDRPCRGCSYSLRGLPRDGRCPECGAPVGDSLRGFFLAYADPDYLETVRSGLSWVLAGIIVTFIVMMATILLRVLLGAFGLAPATRLVGDGLRLLPTIMLIIGFWRLTRPDPGYVGLEPPTSARRVVRATVAVNAAAALAAILLRLLSGGSGGGWAGFVYLGWSVVAIGFAAWVGQFFAVLAYVRWLARRIPDEVIDRRCQTYAWLLPLVFVFGLLVLVGPLVAVTLYWLLLNRVQKQVRAIQSTGLPSRFV